MSRRCRRPEPPARSNQRRAVSQSFATRVHQRNHHLRGDEAGVSRHIVPAQGLGGIARHAAAVAVEAAERGFGARVALAGGLAIPVGRLARRRARPGTSARAGSGGRVSGLGELPVALQRLRVVPLVEGRVGEPQLLVDAGRRRARREDPVSRAGEDRDGRNREGDDAETLAVDAPSRLRTADDGRRQRGRQRCGRFGPPRFDRKGADRLGDFLELRRPEIVNTQPSDATRRGGRRAFTVRLRGRSRRPGRGAARDSR